MTNHKPHPEERQKRLLSYATAAGATLSVGLGLASSQPADAASHSAVQDPDHMIFDHAFDLSSPLLPPAVPLRPIFHTGVDGGGPNNPFSGSISFDVDDGGSENDLAINCYITTTFPTTDSAALVINGNGNELELLIASFLSNGSTIYPSSATTSQLSTFPLTTGQNFYVGLSWRDIDEGGQEHVGWIRINYIGGGQCEITGSAFTDGPSIRVGFEPNAVTLKNVETSSNNSSMASWAAAALAGLSGIFLALRRRVGRSA